MTTTFDDPRARVDAYLERTGLSEKKARVVPLTGDASDRKYFRLLVPKTPSRVLAAYPAPFDYDSLTFVNVATLLLRMPVPVPAILGHAGDLGVEARVGGGAQRVDGDVVAVGLAGQDLRDDEGLGEPGVDLEDVADAAHADAPTSSRTDAR